MKKAIAILLAFIFILSVPLSASALSIKINIMPGGTVTCKQVESDFNIALLLTLECDPGYELDFLYIATKLGAFEEFVTAISADRFDENSQFLYTTNNSYDNLIIAPTFKEKKLLMGDFNGDGSILVDDALAVLRMAAKIVTPTKLEVCDMDSDGTVTVADALAILRIAAKLD